MLVLALVAAVPILATQTGGDDTEDAVASQSTERSAPTSTAKATTTTIDLAAITAAYNAGAETACAAATAAPLSDSLDDAVNEAMDVYELDWGPAGSRPAFREAVAGCAGARREARLAAECGGQPNVELMNRDPEQFKGQCFTMRFLINQFDQGTGRCAFRGYFDTLPREYNFQYRGENGIVSFDDPCPGLDPVGTDDVVRVRVVSLGGVDYDTTIGGHTSAAAFHAVGPVEMIKNN